MRESGINGRIIPFLSDLMILATDFGELPLALIELFCQEWCMGDEFFPFENS
jgi:hypothetical protein